MAQPKRNVLPEYDAAATGLATEIVKAIAFASSPILDRIQKIPATELPREGAPVEAAYGAYAPVAVENVLTERIETILSTDIDSWLAMLDEQGEKAAEQIEKQFFEFMARVTADAGQVIDAKGKPLSHDLINDMLEKLQIDFDDDGKPELPTLVATPKTVEKLGEPTAEQLKRRDEIIERKRREFIARRRVRKLE